MMIQTRSKHARRLRLAFALLALALAMMLSASASAQERARDFISPRLSKTQFQQFLQKLALPSEQRQIANIAYTDYETALADLAERLDADAIVAGRQRVDDSLSGKSRVEAEELKQLRAEVYRVYMQAGPEADAALDMLIGGIEVILLEDQLPKFDAASKWLNREILLHPRASASTSQEYAGDGVDVLELVEEARAEGGELAAIDPDMLNPILNRYEDELDEVIRATSAANREGQMLRKIATITKDIETLKREDAAAIKRWQQLYDLNKRTVQQVAAAAETAINPAAGKAFAQRFDRASFAWLYPRKKPDRQIEWIRARPVNPDVLAKAEAVYAAYITKRNGLSRSAIDMMLKARLEFQTFLYAMMDQTAIDDRIKTSLFADLLKNTGEQSTLESSTSSQLEALLDDEARGDLRDAMRRSDRTARPPMTPAAPR